MAPGRRHAGASRSAASSWRQRSHAEDARHAAKAASALKPIEKPRRHRHMPEQHELGALLAAARAAEAHGDALGIDAISRKAVDLAERLAPDELALGEAMLYRALALEMSDNVSEGYARALEARSLLRDGDPSLLLRAIDCCASTSLGLGRTERSLAYMTEALHLAEANELDRYEVSRIRIKLAEILFVAGDLDAAIECLSAVLELDGAPNAAYIARVRLATYCQASAERLRLQGRVDDAARLSDLAKGHLPAMLLPDGLTAAEAITVMESWVRLQCSVGNLADAERGALALARQMRRHGHNSYARALARVALSDFHAARGELAKAIGLRERAATRLRGQQDVRHELVSLAQLHARNGDPVQALASSRRARADANALRARQVARWRAAVAAEHAFGVGNDSRQGELLHEQRLAVVGRLMSTVYAEVTVPIERLCDQIAALSPNEPTLPTQLLDIAHQIDKVGLPLRRLKMFSYRASVQRSAVALRSAIEDAWQGIQVVGAADPGSRLSFSEPSLADAQADTQRLAILLHVLIQEMSRVAANGQGTGEIGVEIADGVVCFKIAAADPSRWPGQGSASMGLCAELAHEMGGSLTLAPPMRRTGGQGVALLKLPAA
jgi:tetratricopeptide (TPR) repeat protein